jgi:NADPH2:quinone reductase
MRVVVGERVGGPEVLGVTERAAPRPGPGEIVVDVAAAGVNFMDIYQREGAGGYRTEPPFVPGGEGAGTVAAVGEDVTGLGVGDRVAWAGPGGSYAEQVALLAKRAVPVPDGVSLQVAAAAILQGITAHYLSATTYPVHDGDVAVVHAAAGGVVDEYRKAAVASEDVDSLREVLFEHVDVPVVEFGLPITLKVHRAHGILGSGDITAGDHTTRDEWQGAPGH